jgi:hypothetical protein
MSSDTPTAEADVTRRLEALAATATLDPEAWDKIAARTGVAGSRGRGWRRARRWLPAAAAVAALAGVGASALVGDEPDRVETSPDGPVAADNGAGPAGESGESMAPCPSPPQAGIACVERAEGDVDGDRALDAVALFYELVDRPPAERTVSRDAAAITVRVAYATGETDEVRLDGSAHAARLVGVADLDGDERDEVVYVVARVADTSVGGFAGLGATGGLHTVGFAEPTALFGASLERIAGFSCPDVDGDGARELVLEDARFADGTATITTRTYRWVGDRLELVDDDTRNEPADDRRAGEIREELRGPRCDGLDEPAP